MTDFGFWEFALVMFIALLVVGPDRLPQLAAEIGKWVGKIKRMAASFKEDLAHELDNEEIKKTIGLQQGEIESLQADVRKSIATVNQDLRDLDPMAKSLEEQIEDGRFVATDATDAAEALTDEPEQNSQDESHDRRGIAGGKDKGTVANT